jgi:glutaredoxin
MAATRRTWIALAAIVVMATATQSWWSSRSTDRVAAEVARLAAPGDIRMLSSTTCPICTRARNWFKAHEVAYDECFIETDAACAARFQQTRSPGTPVILVRGRPLVGFNPERIALALNLSPTP